MAVRICLACSGLSKLWRKKTTAFQHHTSIEKKKEEEEEAKSKLHLIQ
jgi:hypothetical protein